MRRQIILLIPWCDYLHLADEDAVRWRCLRTIKERTLSFSSSFLLQENYAVRLIRDYLVTHTITDTLEIILIQGSARTHTCTSSLFLKMVFVVKIHRFILNNKIFLYLWLISMWFFCLAELESVTVERFLKYDGMRCRRVEWRIIFLLHQREEINEENGEN